MAHGSIKKEDRPRHLADQNISFIINRKLLTEDSRKKVMYRNVSRLVGKEKPFYSLEIKTRNGNVISLEIETKPFIKNGKIVGEIAFVKKSADTTKSKGKKRADKEAILSKKVNEKNDESISLKSEFADKSAEIDLHKQDIYRTNEKSRLSNEELEEKEYEISLLKTEQDGRLEDMKLANNNLEKNQKHIEELHEKLEQTQKELEIRNEELELSRSDR